MTTKVQQLSIQAATPLITVAMSVYNGGEYLRLAVMSIINQTYQHWELLLIDDGSSDNAMDTIADINDSRIIIIRDGVNMGLAARLNQAIDMAGGEYFARMDQDDIAYPDRFEKQISELSKDPGLDLLSVRAITISEANVPIKYFPFHLEHQTICAEPWQGFYMPHPTWMGKLSWFKEHHYSYTSPYCAEDQELLLRTYQVSQFACLPEILFAYRVRNKIRLSKLVKIRYTLLAIQLKHFYNYKQPVNTILSLIIFVIKLVRDCFNSLILLGNPNSPQHSLMKSTDREVFNTLLGSLIK